MNAFQYYLYEKSLLLAFFLIFLPSVYIGCNGTTASSAELNLEGNWQLHHLEGKEITVLEQDEAGLLIGTETGLFQLKGTELVPLGLEDHEIIGGVRLKDGGILASVKATSFSSGDTTLFKLLQGGGSWEPFMNNFGGEERKYTGINKGPIAITPRSDTLLIRGNISVVRSTDGGMNWRISMGKWDYWGGFGALIQANSFHSGLIWVGGINAFSEPYLIRSKNYGESWEKLESIRELDGVIVEGTVYDVITHPDNPDWVLVGLGGAIAQANNVRKSTDGGQTWQNTVLEETGIHTFARSVVHPNVIYASGRDTSGKLHVAATANFGETWEKQVYEEGPSSITVNDLVVQVIDGKEVLIFGTNQGVYSFRLEE